jgi:hypothetical protein
MSCAYPSLETQGVEYELYRLRLQKKLNEGSDLFKTQKRCPSFIWMFPRNISEKK